MQSMVSHIKQAEVKAVSLTSFLIFGLIIFSLYSSNSRAALMSESDEAIKAQTIKSKVCGDKSCKIVFKKLREYGRNGNPKAQAALSLLYLTGTGTEQNSALGVGYMRKAARQGLSFAQFELGVMYILGEQVEKDVIKGTKLIERAANAGFRPAIATLKNDSVSSKDAMANNFDGERLLVMTNIPTLSDLVEYLKMEGAASEGQTGSRLAGRGCTNSSLSCISYKINTSRGVMDWNVFLQQYGAMMSTL
ncbi:tetratricopeptide repeat protein [Aliikangiella marina]|nr:tetratricopeptide repeat protein [Aliikangiella marina]